MRCANFHFFVLKKKDDIYGWVGYTDRCVMFYISIACVVTGMCKALACQCRVLAYVGSSGV